MAELRRREVALMTTDFVLLEVANALCASAWREKAVKLIDGLRSLPDLNIVAADTTLLAEGWHLYRSRPDKEWSLTDCTSMVVAQRESIEQVFTSDRHFEQAGFVKLL